MYSCFCYAILCVDVFKYSCIFFASLKENDAKQTHALRKAEGEKAQINIKEHQIKDLQIELEALQVREKLLEARVKKASIIQHFLENAVKMSVKVVMKIDY